MDAEELIFIDWKSDVGFKWLFARDAVAEHLQAFLRDLASEVESEVQVQEMARDKGKQEEASGKEKVSIQEEKKEDQGLLERANLLGLGSMLEMGMNLPGEQSKKGAQLEYLNVELVTRTEKDSIRKILFDVYVALPGGQRVIVEMQKAPHKGLHLRMLKYLIRGIESSGGVSHVLIALMNFKFSAFWGTSAEGSVVKVSRFFKEGFLVTVELGRFDKTLEELETGLDRWLFLFKNITKLKSVPEVFRGTIFEKIMEMSSIKTLPKQEKEDWKKELDNNRYVQEAIEINREQAFAEGLSEGVAEKEEATINAYRKGKEEGVAEKEEATINAYQRGKLNQLKANIAKMKSKGMTEEQIRSILDLEELPDLDRI